MTKIRVFIVDDHQIVLEGIKSLFENNDNIEVVDVAANGKQAIEKIDRCNVNIVLMNIEMPVMNGCEATQIITDKYPDIKVIAFTMYNERALINNMLNAGAKGYLLKNIGKKELVKAIIKVNKGEEYFSSEIPITLLKPLPQVLHKYKQLDILISHLTHRETEVLKHIALGMSNSEIGNELTISPRTVDSHRTNLMKKLSVHNIAGLIRYAIENQLID